MMELLHASGETVKFPQIRKSQNTKDFSWGFYCTSSYEQAKRWAKRNRKTPTINYYTYKPNSELKVLKFEDINEEWLDFIAACRSGKVHTYDIVEGPMADDQIWDWVKDYLNGRISRAAFRELAKFNHATHQISFHTLSAIECLTFQRSEVLK